MDLNEISNGQEELGRGYLVIWATTARGAIPIEGARVDVRNERSEPSGERGEVVASEETDRDGKTTVLPLAAPPRSTSLSPESSAPPFFTYTIEVRTPGYYDQLYVGVPIFDGITAIQNVDLIPLPENGRPDGYTPHNNRTTSTESPDL